MKFYKDDKYINYELVVNDKYPYVCEYKNKTVYINVRKKYDKEVLERFIYKQFEHLYQMINDLEYRKFYGKKVVHYLGKTYYAKTKKADKDEVIIKGDTITVYSKIDTYSQHKAIYKKYLKKAVEETVVKYYYDAQNDFKEITIPKIIVKGLKSKKCLGMNTFDTIYLGVELGRFNEKYIKAVFYHELCHFFEYEHNDKFYSILDQKMKDGSKLDKEIDKIIYVDEF